VFKCGFQWGTVSKIKWLANASGIAIKGLGIWVAIAAPTRTCGVSNIVKVMLYNWFMLVNIAVTLLGVLMFLFIFWKRLKEDYASEIIFQSATFIILGIFIGSFLSSRLFPNWFFWASLLGGSAGLTLAIIRFKIKFYESLEAFIIASLPWLSLVFLMNSVATSSLSSFLAFLVILVMVFVSYFLDTHYKSFTWYKSGKIGFAGIATASLIFIMRAALAIGGVTMLSFAGKYEAILSGVMAFCGFMLLFNLGRSEK
jgi:hypothetical protein